LTLSDAFNICIYDAVMRTRFDLDPDVDARLRALAREQRHASCDADFSRFTGLR